MDALDLGIAKLLAADGRLSYREIARLMGISEPTARQRVRQMIDSGKVTVKASINIDAFPEMLVAYVGLKQTGNPHECMNFLSKIPEVVYVINAIGRYDIIAVLAVSSRERLADIMTNEIFGEMRRTSLNIMSSETHIVLYNRNLFLPADKIIDALDRTVRLKIADLMPE